MIFLNTCAAAIKSLKDLKNINYLTVHIILERPEMLKSVVKASKKYNKKLRVLAITFLQVFQIHQLKKMGHTKSIKDLVRKNKLFG